MGGQSQLGSIGIDNRAIGRMATEHLLLGGARRVGIITGPMNWWEARQRQLGWRESLQERGLPAQERQVVHGDWGATSGEDGLYRLLEQEPELDAVFASNDQMALGVLHAAHRLGRRVPEELSVVGVDNSAEASHFWPALTTVDQPLRNAGALAVREIDNAIRRSRSPRRGQEAPAAPRTLLQPELVIRESSRGAP
jgi:LacI family transcriptional regulator